MNTLLMSIARKIIPGERLRSRMLNQYHKLMNYRRYGTTDFFSIIEFQTITTCTRKCAFCPMSVSPLPPKLMSMKLIEKLVMELKEIDYAGWFSPHLYGEPLLDKRLPGIFRLAKKNIPKAFNVIYSNGDLLTVSKFKEIINAGCDLIIVTQYDKEMSSAMKSLFKNLSIAKKTHISYRITDKKTPLSTRGGLVKPVTVARDYHCPLDSVSIDVHGKVVICSDDYLSTSVFGDLNKNKLVEIWKSERYTRLRKELKKGHYSEEICKRCRGL